MNQHELVHFASPFIMLQVKTKLTVQKHASGPKTVLVKRTFLYVFVNARSEVMMGWGGMGGHGNVPSDAYILHMTLVSQGRDTGWGGLGWAGVGWGNNVRVHRGTAP